MVHTDRSFAGFPAVILGLAILALGFASDTTFAQKASGDVLTLDFEQGTDLSKYPMVKPTKGVAASIVARPDGTGHCLQLRNTKPSLYCNVSIEKAFTVGHNMAISLDHRAAIEGGEGAYLGVRLVDTGKNPYLTMPRFTRTWSTMEQPLGLMKGHDVGTMQTGTRITEIGIYGRARGNVKAKNQTAVMTVWLDNIRIYTGKPKTSGKSGVSRVSYTNPPMFDWPRRKSGKEKLQYSEDSAFPSEKTVTVELDRAFYAPPKPLPGTRVYYRHWTGNDAREAWSDYSEIVFNEEVHNYIAPEIDYERLASSAHPRFAPLYLAERGPLDDAARKALTKQAKNIARKGIPDDPPKLELKSGRWKHRVDWINKIAGKITAPTGARLFRIGEAAALTQDAATIDLARKMVVEVATKWNPKGGSAMWSNDLHSAVLLRGIASCYDASCNTMTPEERKTVRENITIRTKQFYAQLNPLKGNEAQNHTWNKGMIVGITGLALAGEVPDAKEWLDCTVGLYAYRFLPSMGFQGDNQEGLSYWAYGVGLMAKFTEPMYQVAKLNLYKHPWMHATGRFPMYCAPAGSYIVPLGDVGGEGNHSRLGPIGAKLAGMIGERAGDPCAMWYGGLAETIHGVTPRPPVDLAPSILFRHIGWAIFNTSLTNGEDNVMVGMRSGKYYAGHQHADINHFFINAYGDKLAVDGGYYDWYGSPHFNAYSVQTPAHNTILVNGKGQKWKAEKGHGRVTAWFDSPAFGYTSGDASNPDIYQGALKQFDRRLLFLKPGFVIVHDLLESAGESARFDWLMHSHTDDPIPVDAGKGSFQITRPKAELLGRLLAPKGMEMAVTRSFDPADISKRKSTEKLDDTSKVLREWTMTATPRERKKQEEFLAAMQIRRSGDSAPPAAFDRIATKNALGVTISEAGSKWIVLFRKQNGKGELEAEELRTDGDAAAVETTNGKVVRSMAIAARTVSFKGKTLHQSKNPDNWSDDGLPSPSDEKVKGAWLEENGKRRDLAGWVRHQPQGDSHVYWTILKGGSVRRVEVGLVGWKGTGTPFLTVNNRPTYPLTPGSPIYGLTLPAGANMLTLTGQGNLEGLRIRGGGPAAVLEAEMLPVEYAPGTDAILIEAEEPTTEGPIPGKTWEKAGASGGKANCGWERLGIWASWDFDVPKTGEYEVLVRHCALATPVVREMRMDGKGIGPQAGLYRFAATGGWSRESNDWRYFVLTDAKSKPARVRLTKGNHTLRMESVETPFNTDCFIVRPAR